MITVSELQTRRVADIKKILEDIERKIINEENAGRRSLNFYLKANAPVDDLMAELDRHGFDVQHKSGSDQRDGDWSYLEIRWS